MNDVRSIKSLFKVYILRYTVEGRCGSYSEYGKAACLSGGAGRRTARHACAGRACGSELLRIRYHTGYHGQEGSGARFYRSYGYGAGLLRRRCTPSDSETVRRRRYCDEPEDRTYHEDRGFSGSFKLQGAGHYHHRRNHTSRCG